MFKILIYADVDMNIIDGSTIWLTSISEMLAKHADAKIRILLKRPIQNNILINGLISYKNIEIIDPWQHREYRKLISEEKGSFLLPRESLNFLTLMNGQENYDTILIRGLNVVRELLDFPGIVHKCIIYSLGQHNGGISRKDGPIIMELSKQVKYLACQTEELSNYYAKAGFPKEKLFILPPITKDIDESKISFQRKGQKLIYAGKFSKDYYSLEIIKAFGKINKKVPNSELHLIGDKFYNRPTIKNFKEEVVNLINTNEKITWYGALPRNEVSKLIQDADVGISWRSEDLNHSMEISTKIIEYGCYGKPILLNRTPMHEKLLGRDYPLFVNSKDEFIEKAVLCLTSDTVYEKAALKAFNAFKVYTYKYVFERIKDNFFDHKPQQLKSSKIKPLRRKLNVVVSAHDFKFIKEIVGALAVHPSFHVKIDPWQAQTGHDEKYSFDLLNWADIMIAEWCLGNAVWYANHKRPSQKLIVRLHRHEINTKFPSLLDIDKVDKIVFIAPFIKELMIERIPSWQNKSTLIYNAIKVKDYQLDKLSDSRFNLGMLGFCPKLKRPDKALLLFENLKKIDSRYTLYLKGKKPPEYQWLWQKKEERDYYEKVSKFISRSPCRNSIIYDNWGNDVPEWFRKIGFILSTSDIEGSHQAVAEGMSSGAMPIITGDWKGSELIYPEEYINRDIDQAIEFILELSKGRRKYNTKKDEVMQFANTHFNMDVVMKQWLELLLE